MSNSLLWTRRSPTGDRLKRLERIARDKFRANAIVGTTGLTATCMQCMH